MAEQWATPNVPNGGRKMKAVDVASRGMTSRGKRQVDLGSQASSWSTPSARDWKDTQGMSHSGTNPDGSSRIRLDQLGRQALMTCSAGKLSSLLASWTSSRLSLNPNFVEWLMGLPIGWTDSVPVEMESYLCRQQLLLQFYMQRLSVAMAVMDSRSAKKGRSKK